MNARLSAPPGSLPTPSDLIEVTPFLSPTRENVHSMIARLDDVWNVVLNGSLEERLSLTFQDLVPVLGVPGAQRVLLELNNADEYKRLIAWANLNRDHPNFEYGPYSHLLQLPLDPVWSHLFVPSLATFDSLEHIIANGYNSTSADEPIPHFPTGPHPSLCNVPLFHLPNPFLNLPSNPE